MISYINLQTQESRNSAAKQYYTLFTLLFKSILQVVTLFYHGIRFCESFLCLSIIRHLTLLTVILHVKAGFNLNANNSIRLIQRLDHFILDRFSSKDYRSNAEEFPEFFPSGVFEAVWWAAVTMTTVGYVVILITIIYIKIIGLHIPCANAACSTASTVRR